VVSCVMTALYAVGFPEPAGGIVTGVYPLNFEPE